MNNMAIVKPRGRILHLQWYDSLAKKIKTKSTGLPYSIANFKKAKIFANKLQAELTAKTKKLKEIGVPNITIGEAFEHFLRNNQDKHEKTKDEYFRFYNYFTEDEKFEGQQPCSVITKSAFEDWLNDIKKLPLSKNSIHCIGKQANHFLNHCFEYNYIPVFKVNREVKTKPEIKEKIVFTDEDITKIFSNLKIKNSNFRMLIFLLFYTGLRSSDILTITVDRINLKERIVKYYSPKKKNHREIPFHKDLVKVIRQRIKEIKEGPLINYAKTEAIGHEIRKYFDKLELSNKSCSARTFRKTFITHCRSRYYIDNSIVKELVGHAPGNTTDKYYNEISIKTMREALDKFKRPIVRMKKAGK